MKKVLLSILLMAGSSLCLFSQGYKPITWSVKGGLNFSKETGQDLDFRMGYQLGVGVEYCLTENWAVGSDLMFITKGAKYDYEIIPMPSEQLREVKYRKDKMYLQIPIMASYHLHMGRDQDKSIWLSVGPYIACGVGGKTKTKFRHLKKESDYEDKVNSFGKGVNRFDFGFMSNLNFEYKHYLFTVFGEWGVTKVFKDLGGHNQSYGCNIGYRF